MLLRTFCGRAGGRPTRGIDGRVGIALSVDPLNPAARIGVKYFLTDGRHKSVADERVFGGEPSEHEQRPSIDPTVREVEIVPDMNSDDLTPYHVAEAVGRGEDAV